jgi:hypothetical protein
MYAGAVDQRRFNFAKFNAVSTQFNLVVEASEVLDFPVGQDFGQIACRL